MGLLGKPSILGVSPICVGHKIEDYPYESGLITTPTILAE